MKVFPLLINKRTILQRFQTDFYFFKEIFGKFLSSISQGKFPTFLKCLFLSITASEYRSKHPAIKEIFHNQR